jgi:hypothetical protein
VDDIQNKNVSKIKGNTKVDRVILGKSEAKVLSKWVQEFNKRTDGLVKVSKADVVNFLIANHSPQLSDEEMQSLSSHNFDETRWLGWAMQKMKDAKKKGEHVSFEELTALRKSLLATTDEPIKKKKVSKIHQQIASPSNHESAIQSEQNSSETTQESIGEE